MAAKCLQQAFGQWLSAVLLVVVIVFGPKLVFLLTLVKADSCTG